MPCNVVLRGHLQFELKSIHDACFLIEDVCFLELFPGNFIVDDRQFQGVNLLVLSPCKHCCHTDQVKVLHFEATRTIAEVAVHEINAPEESLFAHFIG